MKTKFYFISRIEFWDDDTIDEFRFLGPNNTWQDCWEGSLSFRSMRKALDRINTLYEEGICELSDCKMVAISMYEMDRDDG